MYIEIMVGATAAGAIICAMVLVLILFIGVRIDSKLEDMLTFLRGGEGSTTKEVKEEEEQSTQ